MQIHHRRPRGMGGSSASDTNISGNALALCVGCHQHIESNRDEAIRMGWIVRQQFDPAAQRVLRRGEWVYLTNDGGIEPEREPVVYTHHTILATPCSHDPGCHVAPGDVVWTLAYPDGTRKSLCGRHYRWVVS